jgi:maltose alpha-D-glucosyltransferase / alpha-amylase
LAERRAKTSPLRDVAGLLRSVDYAGAALIDRNDAAAAPVDEELRSQIIAQFRQRASKAFLRGYRDTTCIDNTPAAMALLHLFLIEKAAYEISYEAANRPTWIGVPLAGLSSLLTRIAEKPARVRHE